MMNLKNNYLKLQHKIHSERVECILCKNKAQTIHHKDENQTNNKLSNLLPVCQECHLLIQHKIDKIFKNGFILPKNINKNRKKRYMAKKVLDERICPQCSKFFTPKRKDMFYCSSYCRFKLWAKQHPRVKIEEMNLS